MELIANVNRRQILKGGVTAGVFSVTELRAQVARPPISDISATIVLDGATYVYPNGAPIPSFSVDFHRDGRVVFRFGRVWEPPLPNLRPYHVKIEKGGTTIYDTEIPSHGWFQQWTFRPTPLAVRKSPAQIVAANRSFPFGDTGCRVNSVSNYTFRGPLDNGGVGKYMPATGERPEIGWTTDPAGQFMLGGSSGPMLAWALAADSVPINYIDEKTGKPISLVQYPSANTYEVQGRQGQPWFAKGPNQKPDNSGYYLYSSGWEPDRAHWPSLTYIAYYATGADIGLLANLQHAANFPTIADAANTSAVKGAVINPAQTRQIAWGLRSMFEAHVATKDAEDSGADMSGLLPSAVYKTILDKNLLFYSRFMADPARQVFRTVGDAGGLSPWGYDYLLTALSLGVLTGHSEWTQLYLWILGSAVARTNGTSGYPPGFGTAYGMGINPGDTWATAWKRAADQEVQNKNVTAALVEKLGNDPLNGGVAAFGHEYLFTTRAVLVMASYLDKRGFAPVRQTYPDLDTCLRNVDRMVRAYGAMNARVSVIS